MQKTRIEPLSRLLAAAGLDYTTWLNIAFLALAAYLVWRFVRSGGVPMLKMMNRPEGMQAH